MMNAPFCEIFVQLGYQVYTWQNLIVLTNFEFEIFLHVLKVMMNN